MAGNTFGTVFKVTTFGESHGPALGAVIDGCPAGIVLDTSYIQKELNRRRPGNHNKTGQNSTVTQQNDKPNVENVSVTSRKEADEVEILSGVFEGRTTGSPIALLIRNTSQHSDDYSNIKDVFRPGHADYTWNAKYGFRDYRGGGRSSGRETASRVAAGAVAKAVLAQLLTPTNNKPVKCDKSAGNNKLAAYNNSVEFSITAYTKAAAGIACDSIDFSVIENNNMRACDAKAAVLMEERIAQLRTQGDSAGGIIECVIKGLPAGVGEPVFDKLDAELAKAMLSIGAVKGIEFGVGFDASNMTGSVMNDAMRASNNGTSLPCFVTNNAGGILGGISNGNDIVFRIAIKPVPSIFQTQQTVNSSGENADILIHGRHDVCLCPRIVPVVEAMTAITLTDLLLRQQNSTTIDNQ